MNKTSIKMAIEKSMADAEGYLSRHTGPNRHQIRAGRISRPKSFESGHGFKTTGKSGGTKVDRANKKTRQIAKSSVQRNQKTKVQRNVRRNSLRKAARR